MAIRYVVTRDFDIAKVEVAGPAYDLGALPWMRTTEGVVYHERDLHEDKAEAMSAARRDLAKALAKAERQYNKLKVKFDELQGH